MSIVVIGTIFVDIKGFPTAKFDPKGRNAGTVAEFHGGVGRNIAEDLSHIGLSPVFLSLADDSGSGAEVIRRLAASGVDTSYLKQTPGGSGTWMAIFDNSGDVYANLSRRADLLPLAETLDSHGKEIFAQADSILLEIDIEEEIVSRVFALAEAADKPVYSVISNMTIALERMEYIRKSSCFVCNQQEAGIFFSQDYDSLDAEEMLRVLPGKTAQAGLKRMIVTMGSRGAVYADPDGNAGICPSICADVIDTTGAGDSFFAGAAAGLTYGKSLAEACEIGTRLAASVISTHENVCPLIPPEELGL